MIHLNLALDWTPNINHIGFFVALEKGFYKELNIDLNIIDPSHDNYAVTPAKKIELGEADFALCPTESIISFRTKSQPFDLIAIGAVLKDDLSAIAVEKSKEILRPQDLDGKIYSSYKAKYEDGIVKGMIKNDGGQGNLEIIYPEKFGIWNTLLSGDADATWIFLNWEGVEVEKMEQKLRYFQMKDYGIPYSYSPVIATSESKANTNQDSYRNFLSASKRGFLFCKDNKDESIEILSKYVPQKDQSIDLLKALEMSVDAFGNNENWGVIEKAKLRDFLDWIDINNLEDKTLGVDKIATTRYL